MIKLITMTVILALSSNVYAGSTEDRLTALEEMVVAQAAEIEDLQGIRDLYFTVILQNMDNIETLDEITAHHINRIRENTKNISYQSNSLDEHRDILNQHKEVLDEYKGIINTNAEILNRELGLTDD